MSVNFIDILLLFVVLSSVVLGWRRGFLLGLLDLVRWCGSLILALRFYPTVARAVGPLLDWNEVWDKPFAFLLTGAAAGLLIHLLGYAFLKKLSPEVHERPLNRALGVLTGFVSGLIFAAILAALLMSVPLPEALRDSSREGVLANRLAVYTERLEAVLAPVFDDAVAETLNKLTIRPESSDRVELGYKVEETEPLPELEARMLEMVNEERREAGLRPLAPDPELTEVARKHSADMFARGYFAHYTPEGRSPFDRIREANVRYRTAGENLALAPTLPIAHNGLMNSPGHRANILHRDFGRVGIGIMDGGFRGLMVTQNFRD